MIGVTMFWRDLGNTVKAEAKTVGIMPPPMKPWTARQTIISLIDALSPHIRLANVNPAADTANSMRVPSARDRKPDNGIATTSATRYAVCTHGISSLEAARPAWISASDADTIWVSRRAMNMPKHMAMKAIIRRGSMRSAALAGAFMSTSRLVRSSACWRGNGGDGTRLGVDGDDYGHAGSQRAALGDVGGHLDANAETLYDLGEIAGCVVGRQQRKHRA